VIESAIATFGLVFVAELGDKSQLIVLAFATRLRPLPVVIGVTLASAVVMGLSVTVGVAVAEVVPDDVIGLVAALAFFAFAAWTLRSEGDSSDNREPMTTRPGSRMTVFTVAATFFVAELGDKTMLATIALATQAAPIGVWAGATLAMVSMSVVAVVVGHELGARLPARWVRLGAAALFAAFGVALLVAVVVT
jgi:Ca2+/H+ antiporter, TMEM165/GDT1 family